MHPVTDEKIPVWIINYVLMDYGTGAIMGVPGHDERDFEFAQKYKIPITRVIDSKEELPYSGQGKLVNSEGFDGLDSDKAFGEVTKILEI